jgi:DNA replicative helicase MCM subunit Mcm2 (Cdc46/Mcm family)
VLPYFESAAKDALKLCITRESEELLNQATIPDFQITLKSAQIPHSLRDLTAEHVNRLVKVFLFFIFKIIFIFHLFLFFI